MIAKKTAEYEYQYNALPYKIQFAVENYNPDKKIQGKDNWIRPSQDIPECKQIEKFD